MNRIGTPQHQKMHVAPSDLVGNSGLKNPLQQKKLVVTKKQEEKSWNKPVQIGVISLGAFALSYIAINLLAGGSLSTINTGHKASTDILTSYGTQNINLKVYSGLALPLIAFTESTFLLKKTLFGMSLNDLLHLARRSPMMALQYMDTASSALQYSIASSVLCKDTSLGIQGALSLARSIDPASSSEKLSINLRRCGNKGSSFEEEAKAYLQALDAQKEIEKALESHDILFAKTLLSNIPQHLNSYLGVSSQELFKTSQELIKSHIFNALPEIFAFYYEQNKLTFELFQEICSFRADKEFNYYYWSDERLFGNIDYFHSHQNKQSLLYLYIGMSQLTEKEADQLVPFFLPAERVDYDSQSYIKHHHNLAVNLPFLLSKLSFEGYEKVFSSLLLLSNTDHNYATAKVSYGIPSFAASLVANKRQIPGYDSFISKTIPSLFKRNYYEDMRFKVLTESLVAEHKKCDDPISKHIVISKDPEERKMAGAFLRALIVESKNQGWSTEFHQLLQLYQENYSDLALSYLDSRSGIPFKMETALVSLKQLLQTYREDLSPEKKQKMGDALFKEISTSDMENLAFMIKPILSSEALNSLWHAWALKYHPDKNPEVDSGIFSKGSVIHSALKDLLKS